MSVMSMTPSVTATAQRVLVVDDEENISFLVESALQLDGIHTARAADGHEALAAVRSFNPHAIVLDVMMPGLDGFEVLRRLPAASLPPVIFVTAHDEHASAAAVTGRT